MANHILQLRRGKSESLRRFHPWIFSGALTRIPENLAEGTLVRVVDENNKFMALGHYQIGSIAVRVLSFTERPIDVAFWVERLSEAFKVRRSLDLVRPDNDIYRLVHGEGDQIGRAHV